MAKYDYAVFIGRFQPFHVGHYHVVQEGLKIAKNVILILGSSYAPRSPRNPFTLLEREAIIRSCFTEEENKRIHTAPVYDHRYNDDRWIVEVQTAVQTIEWKKWRPDPISTVLIGHNKDNSSYYLNIFPHWKTHNVKGYELDGKTLNATKFREKLMNGSEFGPDTADYFVDQWHEMTVKDIVSAPSFDQVKADWKYCDEYVGKWGPGPHTTVDAVVVQSGHVLLIQRGKEYGYGQWANPGGFINRDEKIKDACLRELKEETKIHLQDIILRKAITKHEVFDDPYRSDRARIITHAFLFKLTDMQNLPKVKGSDDAMDAKWFTFDEVKKMREQMFEDHWDIVMTMAGL